MSAMDKVDADNVMYKVHADSFVNSSKLEIDNGKVDANGFDSIEPEFEDDIVIADRFVDSIELEFDPLRYKEFISIMKAYRKSSLSDGEAVIKICELLVGYPSLVEEFNAFLPNGYFLVPSDMREEGDPYITLKTPEGETVYPRDYTRKPLASSSSH